MCASCTGQVVVGDTDHKPVLQLTGLVAGRYVFVLEVTDEAGQKSSSTASLLVKPGLITFSATSLFVVFFINFIAIVMLK